jgi:hypothetical protein
MACQSKRVPKGGEGAAGLQPLQIETKKHRY